MDGWDFKQYVLVTLFYRFISEHFASYIEGGDDSIHYAELGDDIITDDIKDDVEYVAMSVSSETIAANDYNLSVSSYVEAKDTREKIDTIVAEIEGVTQ